MNTVLPQNRSEVLKAKYWEKGISVAFGMIVIDSEVNEFFTIRRRYLAYSAIHLNHWTIFQHFDSKTEQNQIKMNTDEEEQEKNEW